MTVRTTSEQRRTFFILHQQNASYEEIANRFGLSKECVRYWCRKQRDGQSCETHPQHAILGLLHRFDPKVRFVILHLRLEHPHWGPNRILSHSKKRVSLHGLHLPSEASIGRYLHQWRRFWRKPRKKQLGERHAEPIAVHECWQVDFKVGIRLTDGTRVNLHTVRDPIGEACIGAFVFSTGRRQRHIQLEEVRAVLRQCFMRWKTLPQVIQTDAEPVLRTPNLDPFPSDFDLWLIGLGIQHRIIHTVTSNAEVERSHRILNDYALVGNEDQSVQTLQIILDRSLDDLNYELSSRAEGCHGKPPIQAHPELLLPRRPFEPVWELACFNLRNVDQYLSTQSWKRIVDTNGVVPLGGKRRHYSIGRKFAGKQVEIHFVPTDRCIVFTLRNTPDREIKRLPAKNLNVSHLTGTEDWPLGLGIQQLPLPLFTSKGVSY